MSTAAIAIAARRLKYIRKFRKAGAVSPDTAIPLETGNIRPGFMFKRLVSSGVIVETEGNRYYLNETREAQMSKRRRTAALVTALIIAFLLMIGYLLVPKALF